MPVDTANTPSAHPPTPPAKASHFLREIVEQDSAALKWGKDEKGQPRVATRFPPEPNGYLHIGHAKSICLNFGLAADFGGTTNLRFDDTNPAKEEQEYVESIVRDVKWLGFEPERVLFASDYFDRMYEWAEELVLKGHAFVCDLSAEEVSKSRGTFTRPGTPSPFRNRSVEENLDLLRRMRAGEFPDGSRTLRAKIEPAMASPFIVMRDPVMYRILHAHHHNTGDRWSIYPMYDWAHCLEDSIEGITHSVCTLEFENNRPLYDWFIDRINEGRPPEKKIWHPRQIEFARLNLTYTVMSKRFLLSLVNEKRVSGWDDPRMPTLSGMRRRGYPPEAIRAFCEEIGVSRVNSVIDVSRLEGAVRDDLNRRAPRAMAVLRPLKVVIENYPEGKTEELDAVNNPEDPAAGTRKVPFSRELYIERDDFMEVPPKKFFRLSVGNEVRLRWAYFVKCVGVVKDPAGEVVELRCTYDPATRGGDAPDGRKVKGTIHWVSAPHAVKAEVRLFDRLFKSEEPGKASEGNYLADLNPHSLSVVTGYLEPSLAGRGVGERVQFERLGYFTVDPDSKPGAMVWNRTVTLKDTWARVAGRE